MLRVEHKSTDKLNRPVEILVLAERPHPEVERDFSKWAALEGNRSHQERLDDRDERDRKWRGPSHLHSSRDGRPGSHHLVLQVLVGLTLKHLLCEHLPELGKGGREGFQYADEEVKGRNIEEKGTDDFMDREGHTQLGQTDVMLHNNETHTIKEWRVDKTSLLTAFSEARKMADTLTLSAHNCKIFFADNSYMHSAFRLDSCKRSMMEFAKCV